MIWIAYKRGAGFYIKERGEPITEIEVDYETFKLVQRTGEFDNGKTKQREVVKSPGVRGKAKPVGAEKRHLAQPEDAGENSPDEV